MKTIGILGGTSWPSTMSPYQMINAEVACRLGGHHSARIILYSIDYNAIKSLYPNGWDIIPGLLKQELEFALALKPDCLFIANNTLHKAFDIIEKDLPLRVPFFHGPRLTRDELAKQNKQKTLFLGTAFTMEDDFFTGLLRKAGIDLVVPDAGERKQVQASQSRLSAGEPPDQLIREFFKGLLEKYEKQDCKAVVLACTELPLAIDSSVTQMTIIDPLVLQCRAAVDFALSGKDVQWTACA